MPNKGKEKYVFFVILSVCFLALGGIFVKLSALGPINTGLYRVLISIPLLLPFIYNRDNPKKSSPKTKKDMLIVFFAGVFLGFDLLLWNISFSLTTVANANLLANLVPFTIIPISYFVYKEKIPSGFFIGLAITMIGLVLLVYGKDNPSKGSFIGDAMAFSTSIFYALFLSVVYKTRNTFSALEVMFYSAFGSLIVLLPASFLIEGIQIPLTVRDWLPLIALAIFSQILGQGGLSYCLGKITPVLASALVLTQPVISAIYAYFIFDENLAGMELLGIFIILFGVFLSKRTFS